MVDVQKISLTPLRAQNQRISSQKLSSILAYTPMGTKLSARRASLWSVLPLWAQNQQISSQKSIAVVDAVQKLSSILTHTLWAQNWQITGQKSIAVVDVVQKLGSHPCGHKTSRFLARRTSLWLLLFKTKFNFDSHPLGTKLADYWPEEHRCGRCCSKTRLTPLWAQNQQISSQKNIAVVAVVQN